MSSPLTTEPCERDEALERFLLSVDEAADVAAVVEKWCADHPQRAEEFRSLVAMRHLLDDVPRNQDGHAPERLGDFEIVREVARGGMGIVYEAIQRPLDRRVAVKTIRQGRISPALRERFLREQRVLARLHQSHIVPVFAAGREDDIEYFAMPFIEGATLQHVIRFSRASGSTHPTGDTPSLSELARVASAVQPGPATDATPTTRMERPRMAASYFRSVADVMANVADAIQHAHQAGILHRDIKPSNVMVDESGQCWIIDFGLARLVRGEDQQTTVAGVSAAEPTLTDGVLGTLRYMAPEQFDLRADERSDVWGLGATLYELLTFGEIETSTMEGEASDMPSRVHRPARDLPDVPRDLECVCIKAMSLDPGHRYQAAGALADDLRRWLKNEPTTARPARTLRRVVLWGRRNKGWASAILAVVLASLISVGATTAAAIQARRAERNERRGSLMLEAQALTEARREAGWSERSSSRIRQAAEIQKDAALRDLAVASLIGLDARLEKSFQDFGASQLAFDPQGTGVLLGGAVSPNGNAVGAKRWDFPTQELHPFNVLAQGPLAFRDDGRPVQFAVRPGDRVPVLLALDTGAVVTRFILPADARIEEEDELRSAMTPNAGRAASSVRSREGKELLVIWDAKTGKTLQIISQKAVSLALSPDGTILASGDEDGGIVVWSVATGQQLVKLSASWNAVQALAFARDRRVRWGDMPESEERGWLLAAGDTGGMVTIWDLSIRLPRAFCHGSEYDVKAVAFSPDGMTFASAGRGLTKLWDITTGRLLLDIRSGDYIYGLAFSPDGRRLATATGSRPSSGPWGTIIWELDAGAAGRKLRGLSAQVSKVCISRDGSSLAALSHSWEIGVWDMKTGFLRCVLPAPKGFLADNAALALSRDGRQLAMTTLHDARLWDTESGRELDRWRLPGGLADALGIDANGRPVSCRLETQVGEPDVFKTRLNRKDYPTVCRIRHLLPGGVVKPLAEIRDFSWKVLDAAASADGQYFVIAGRGGPEGNRLMIKAFDMNGAELFEIPHQLWSTDRWCGVRVDPTGRLAAAATILHPENRGTLVELPSGRFKGTLESMPGGLAPEAKYWTTRSDQGTSLYRRTDAEPIVRFERSRGMPPGEAAFDSTGRVLAWGNTDGSVTVCDIPQLRRQLAEIQLDW